MSEVSSRKKRSIIKREKNEQASQDKKSGKNGWKVVSKHRRISPKKLTPVVNVVRGMSYTKAMAVLSYIPRKGADIVKRTLASAVSNALYLNNNLDEEDLFVKEIFVNEGPRMKRIKRGSRGQADIVLKRTSHIVVVIAKREEKENK